MKWQKVVAVTLVFSFVTQSVSLAAQGGGGGGGTTVITGSPFDDDSGEGSPPIEPDTGSGEQTPPVVADPPAQPLPRPVDIGARQCAFKPDVTDDEQTLLNNVLNQISALERSDGCQPPQGQRPVAELFGDAIRNYQTATGANLPGGYAGNITETCWNYERLFNSEYDYFLANWAPGRQVEGANNFRTCSSSQDRSEVAICAAEQLASLKSRWENECRRSADATQAAQAVQTRIDTMQLAMQSVQMMLANQNCVDTTGAGRAGLIQSGFQLAARAAMIGMSPASPFTILASGAVDLIGNLLRDLFTGPSPSEQIAAQTQFTDMACLYEDIENRAFSCTRTNLEAQLESNLDAERLVCEQARSEGLESYLGGLRGLLPQLSTVSQQLAAVPAAGGAQSQLTSDQVLSMANELAAPVAGTSDTTPLATTLNQAADRVLTAIPANMTRLQLVTYGQEHDIPVGTPEQVRALNTSLMASRQQATAMKNFIAEIQQGGAALETALDLPAEHLSRITAAFPRGGIDSFDHVLAIAQRHAPSEADAIATFNSRLAQGKSIGALVTAQNERRAVLRNVPLTNGIFESHRAGLQRMMSERFENELERLVERAQADQRNFNFANLTQERRNAIISESVYPIARMCSRLRTIAINMSPTGAPSPDGIPSACRPFMCNDSSLMGSFNIQMANTGNTQRAGLDDRRRCTTRDCNGYYSQFMCQERTRGDTLRDNLIQQFNTDGKICGQDFARIRFN